MKTVMISTRLFALALVSFLTMAVASPALANEETKTIPVELKFIGNVKEQPLFHLVFNGKEEKEYTISIRDEYGNLLYRENVKGTSFTKKFILNTDEVSDSELSFEVTSKGYDKPVKFEVNKQLRYSEDVVVNKVN